MNLRNLVTLAPAAVEADQLRQVRPNPASWAGLPSTNAARNRGLPPPRLKHSPTIPAQPRGLKNRPQGRNQTGAHRAGRAHRPEVGQVGAVGDRSEASVGCRWDLAAIPMDWNRGWTDAGAKRTWDPCLKRWQHQQSRQGYCRRSGCHRAQWRCSGAGRCSTWNKDAGRQEDPRNRLPGRSAAGGVTWP